MFGGNKLQILRVLPRIPTKILRSVNVLLGQIIYVNAAGFLQNFIGNWLMEKEKKSSGIKRYAHKKVRSHNRLRDDGYLRLDYLVDDPKIHSLGGRFSRWCEYNSDKENQYRLQISSKDYGDDLLIDFPEIRELINDEIQSSLLDYYECDFEVINVHLYRTRKPEDLDLINNGGAYGSTMCWHSDGSYTDTLKVFFLLSEVKNEDGPMLLMDKASSNIIFRSKIPFNFLKHGQPESPQFQKWTSEFIGKPGQCLIVDTNKCLHRASVPNDKPRDMITFYIGIKRNLALDRFHNIERTGEGLTGRFQ